MLGLSDIFNMLFGRRRAARSPVAPRDILAVVEADPEFRRAVPDLMRIRPEVQDIFIWLAHAMHLVLTRLGIGDEYGIYVTLVHAALTGGVKWLRKLDRYFEDSQPPRYALACAVNRVLTGVKLLQLSYNLNVLGVMRVLECSRYMDMPFTFVLDMKVGYLTPTKINLQWLYRTASVPRVPGPRLYVNIEKCLHCVGDDDEVHCYAYVEDGECIPPDSLPSAIREEPGQKYPSTEVIYVEKHINRKSTPEEKRIIVAFAYSLTGMLTDETNYLAFCSTA